jgi:hypothetical protein
MATKWSVPRMWEGETVIVLASGPSMSQEVADLTKNRITIAVNDTFTLAPWANMLYAADSGWWKAKPLALKFEGLKVTADERTPFPEVFCLQRTMVNGFDPNPGNVATGGNSGYQAVHVAIHAGAKKILLAGFDMSATKGAHFFGKHKRPLHDTDPVSYEWWKNRFNALKNRGAEIINCSPDSQLQCFPFGSLSDG